MRSALLISNAVLVLGAIVRIRYGPNDPEDPVNPPLDMSGQAGPAGELLNAAAGAWLRAAPFALAAIWFPVDQRGLAITAGMVIHQSVHYH